MSCTEARRLTLLGLEEFEAAIFDEGNIAPAEFDLERVAVMRGAEQHRLPAERDSSLTVVEHAVSDIFGLSRLILDIGQERSLRRSLGRIKGLRDPRMGLAITAFAASRIGWVER